VSFARFALLRTSKANPDKAGFLHSSCSSYKFSGPKFLVEILATFIFIFAGLVVAREARAAFASGFSIAVGEEYNDNIFFSNQTPTKANPKVDDLKNKSDFITHLVPTFTFSYAPPSETTPTLTASLSPEGQIFAHNSSLNNFGDNISFNSGYTYRYSPRLTFHVGDTFGRQGSIRTVGLEALGPPPQLPGTPTQFPSSGAFIPLPFFLDVGGLVTKGSTLANFISFDGVYLYAPSFTISGGYSNGYSNSGGVGQVSNSIGVRGSYNWRQQHNLHAGLTVTVLTSPGGSSNNNGNNGNGNGVVYNIDAGDDYFSALQIQLDPTWTLSGSTGIGINTARGGPGVFANGSLTLVKVWERATFNIAYRRGLTPSFGISGVSQTTTISSGFGIRLTERMTGLVGADYSISNTNSNTSSNTSSVDFKVFRASAGLQYWFTNWLSSNFMYSYRFCNCGSATQSNNTSLVSGKVQGNSVLLALSAHFDLWPNPALARGAMHPLYPPMGAPVYAPPELQQPLRLPPGTLPGQPQSPVPSQPPASP
jgi:hypothetical protein